MDAAERWPESGGLGMTSGRVGGGVGVCIRFGICQFGTRPCLRGGGASRALGPLFVLALRFVLACGVLVLSHHSSFTYWHRALENQSYNNKVYFSTHDCVHQYHGTSGF